MGISIVLRTDGSREIFAEHFGGKFCKDPGMKIPELHAKISSEIGEPCGIIMGHFIGSDLC